MTTQANGSEQAGARAIPFRVVAGNYSIVVDWYVVWTLNASTHSNYLLSPSTECTWWEIGVFGDNMAGTHPFNTFGWGPHTPICLSGNRSFNAHHGGHFFAYLNASLPSNTYYIETSVSINSGAFENSLGRAMGSVDIASNGNYARLVSITIT